MKIVTAEEMREIDRRTIETVGIPSQVLMERAGSAVAAKILELYPRKKLLVLCGGGNNGGDGIVAARELHNAGWHVKVFLFVKQNRLSPPCLQQYEIAKKMGIAIQFRTALTPADLHSAIVIDALLGTGLNKNVEGAMAKAIGILNNFNVPVVSVDIPSGISSDTGQVMGCAVRADCTVTFGLPKRGHLLHPGAGHTGRLFVENIGFPEELLTSPQLSVELIENGPVAKLLPDRPRYSHKGDYGHVLVVAGSRGKTGAALMAAKACYRSGAGLVTLGVPESLVAAFESRVSEEMLLPLPDTGKGTLAAAAAEEILTFLAKTADVLAVGPGIGVSADTEKMLEAIITGASVPTLIDADGLNSIPDIGIFAKARSPMMLTPHPGEMSRLLMKSTKSMPARDTNMIERDRIGTASSLAEETGTYVVLKGVPTVIAEPEGRAFISTAGNPGMATGGSGDVLTGIISGLLGQHTHPLQAAVLGAYLHGLVGDIGATDRGEHSLIASDIIEALPRAFLRLRQ